MRKGLIMTGAAVIAAAGVLAGCGGTGSETEKLSEITAQSVAQMASDNMEDVKSYSFDGDTKMKYSVSASGVSMDMDVDINLSGEGILDTHEAHVIMDMDMSTLGQEQKMKNEAYAIEEDGKYVVYSKSEEAGTDGSWTKTENDTKIEFEKLNNMNVYQQIADGKIDATLSDGEKVNGKDTYKLEAVIPGELFQEVYSFLGQDSTAGMSGIDFSQANAKCELYIYKDTGLPARTYMDAKEYGEAIFKQAMSETGSDSVDLEISVDDFDVDMVMDDYNTIDNIEIPAEVLSAV